MEHTNDGPMAGRTVLVTGATSGIGRATALGLATMGAHVASNAHATGRIDFDDLQGMSSSGGRAYSHSKLANVLSPISWPRGWVQAQSPPTCCIRASCEQPSELKTPHTSSDSWSPSCDLS